MNRDNLEAYITQFGDKRINIRGKNVDKFLAYPSSEVVKRTVRVGNKEKVILTIVISFESEKKMIESLQDFVSRGIPFCDDIKSTAFMDACAFSKQGILDGKILSC